MQKMHKTYTQMNIHICILEENLKVKRPTIWTDDKAELGRVREKKRRDETRREERRGEEKKRRREERREKRRRKKIREEKEPEERRCRCAKR